MEKEILTDVEYVIMQVIWESLKPLQLGEIMRKANERTGNDWKSQTVATYLQRLMQKEFLEILHEGRFSTYRAVVDKNDYISREMARFADKWGGGNPLLKMAVSFQKKQTINEEQKKELRDFLDGLD